MSTARVIVLRVLNVERRSMGSSPQRIQQNVTIIVALLLTVRLILSQHASQLPLQWPGSARAESLRRP